MIVPLAIAVSGLLASIGVVTLATDNGPIADWLQYIQSGGVIAMFIILFYALLTRKVVMGWTYDQMVGERDYYRNIAYKTTDIADRQVHTAEEMMKRMDTIALRSEVLEGREDARRGREDTRYRREERDG